MDDLISRSELTQAIKRQYCIDCDSYDGLRCRACHVDDMLSLVDDVLSVDAVPVVRCKECKECETDCGFCDYWETGRNFDDYCSRGVRKEDAHAAD